MKDNNFILLDDDGEDTKNDKSKEGGDSSSQSQQRGNKLEERIKLSVFNVFAYLLKNGLEISPWKIYVLVGIEFVQLLQFSFHPSLISQWKDYDSLQYLSIGSQVFSLRYWIDQANIVWGDHLIIFYAIVLLVFFIIILFLYASFSVSNQGHQLSFTWPLTLLQFLCLLLTTCLFQPLLEFILSMLACQTVTKETIVSSDSTKTSTIGSLANAAKSSSPLTQLQQIQVVSMYNDIVCFEGTHILHSCLAVVVGLLLVALTIMVVFLYFESRKVQQILVSKIHTKVDLYVTLIKLILVLVFSFLLDDSFVGFKILTLVVASTVSFIRVFIDRPFYNLALNKVMSVLHGIFAWTNYLILLGALLGNTQFNMLLFIFLLGIPIIVVLILTMRMNANMKILLTPVSKFQKGDEALDQVIELVYLIQSKEIDRQSAIMIKGFVNYHEMTCVDDECSLKQYKKYHLTKSITNSRHNSNGNGEGGFSGNFQSQSHQKFMTNESNSLLLNFTKKLLEKSIKRFPKCTILKITYSNFLLDHMGNKREAMRELNECSRLKPSIDQQFIIFRYKKLIGDSLIESGKESGGYEYISAVNFDANFRKCKQNIERSALLHFEFWNHLQEESPDLKRLMDLGIRIDQQLKIVEFHWDKMQNIYPNTPKAVKLYAMFLIEVVNDKESGNELLQKAKDSAQIRTNFEFNGNGGGGSVDEMGGGANLQDGSPLVYISGENDRMGLMSSINLSACKIFGYLRKEELLNKNIKMLMPQIYAQNHDEFVRSACMKTADQITNKERSVYGKHTSGYIFPVSLQIKFFQSFLQGKQFAATLKTEKKGINTSVAYLIIDPQGKILEASSSAQNLLDIDKNSHQHQKKRLVYDLTVLINGLLREDLKMKYLGKQGDRVLYHYPEIVEFNEKPQHQDTTDTYLHQKTEGSESSSEEDADPADRPIQNQKTQNRFKEDITVNSSSQPLERRRSRAMKGFTDNSNAKGDLIKASEDKSQSFICNMFHISFVSIENSEPQGYSVRLEMIDNEDEDAEKQFLLENNIQDPVSKKLVKCSDFQFSFNPIYKKFVRELRDEENQDPLIDTAYLHVKKENLKRSEDQPKLTVMSYLNHLKTKLEKQEEVNSAAMMSDDYFIREVDEYSEETHSDDMYNPTKKGPQRGMTKGGQETFNDALKYKNTMVDESGRNMSKRINELINSRYMPGVETPEKLFEKIQEITEIMRQKSMAGDGIKTYRICDGEISLVEEVTGQFLIKNTEAASLEAEDTTDDEQEEDDGDGFKTSLKSRKAFQAQLNDRSVPRPVKNLQFTANIVLLIFIILSIVEYSVVRSDLQSIGTNYQAIQNRFQLISEMQRSSYYARSLVLYARGIYQMNDTHLSLAKEDMKASLNTIYSLQSEINLQKLTVSAPHQTLLDSKVVQMYFKQQESTTDIKALNFSLTEGLLQISSSLFTLTNLENKLFDDKQDDVFYFLYNNFQDTLMSMQKSANYFVSELDVRTATVNEANKIVFYLSIGCVFTSVLMLIPVVHIVNKTKQKYLEVFLDLDNNNIRKLSAKCEKYMNMVQDENNEEINSNDDELEDMARGNNEEIEDEYSMQSGGGRRSKKKRAKNTISNKRMFVIKFIIGMMIIEVYFFQNFFVFNESLSTFNIMAKELNITASMEPFFWLSLNAQRELYADSKRPILGKNSFDVAREMIAQVQQIGSEMQQEHLQNKAYASTNYNTDFSNSMLKSVCPLVDSSFQNYTGKACEMFISGSTTQGLHTVIVRFEEGLRKVLSMYQSTANRTNVTELKKLLNSQDITDLFYIQRFILSAHMENVVLSLQTSVQSQVSSSLETRLAIFTLFAVLLLLLFVIVWIPFINGLSTEVHQTKRIMLLIPIELLMGLKNVASLLNSDKNKLLMVKGGAGVVTTVEPGAKKGGAAVTTPD